MRQENSNAYVVLIGLVSIQPFRSRFITLYCVWVYWTYPSSTQHPLGCDTLFCISLLILAGQLKTLTNDLGTILLRSLPFLGLLRFGALVVHRHKSIFKKQMLLKW